MSSARPRCAAPTSGSRPPTAGRRRLGVAILFDRDTTAEIDGLRRGLGEPDLFRIPPHLTLIPPVNVRDVAAAEGVLRTAAAGSRPLALVLGPVATFLPDNPVAYLEVGGDVASLIRLRDLAFVPPLERALSWPYVPHVTVADGIDPERVAAAPAVLHAFHREVTAGAVTLLEETHLDGGSTGAHRWVPIATVPLGPPVVIGRGGLPLELEVLAAEDTLRVTARRQGAVVGSAAAWRRDTYGWLQSLEVAGDARREGIGSHLLAAVQSWANEHALAALEVAPGVEPDGTATAFLVARGWRQHAARLRRVLS